MKAGHPECQPGCDEAPAALLRGWAKAYRDTPEHRFPSDPHAEFFPVDLEFAADTIATLQARVDDLTKALEEIRDHPAKYDDGKRSYAVGWAFWNLQNRARRALVPSLEDRK